MKKSLILILALGALLVATVFFLKGCPPPAPKHNLLALWTFDGSLRDISKHGHDGVPQGLIHYTEDRKHGVGRSLFLEHSAFVRIQDSTGTLRFTKDSSYTISAWIRTPSPNVTIYGWGVDTSALPGLQFGIKAGHANLRFTSSSGQAELSSAVPVSDNRWHLLTLMIDGPHSDITLFVDTSLVASAHASVLADSNNTTLPTIGSPSQPTASVCIARMQIATGILSLPQLRVQFDDDLPIGPVITGVCAPTDLRTYACDDQGHVGIATNASDAVAFNATPITPQPLRAIDAMGNNLVITVGDQGTIASSTDGGVSWISQAVPPGFPTMNSLLENIYAVRILSPTKVLIAGGTVPTTQSDRFVLLGTHDANSWSNLQWQPVALPGASGTMSAISSIATMPGGKDTTILLAGWNGQLYQASSTNLSSWTSPSNTGNYHFTAVDYRPNLSGTAVTDNGVHCTFAPIPSALVPGYITPAGEALWTTIAATSGDWIGGGFNPNAPLYDPDFNQGNGTWSSGIAMTMGTVINGTYTPLSSLPESDQVWFSGARSPSGNARMGGYRFRNPSNPYATPVYRQ